MEREDDPVGPVDAVDPERPGAADVPPRLLRQLRAASPGGLLGVYLYGSTVLGGSQPDSDLDLLMLTERSLRPRERAPLQRLLLQLSGWAGHGDRHPDAAQRRPIEVTGLALGTTHPAAPGRRRDFLYGEWLRDQLLAEMAAPDASDPAVSSAGPRDDPDTIVQVATAQCANQPLLGPPLAQLLSPVGPSDLRRALRAIVPDVLAGTTGDERNALLTLARILVTLDTGEIVPKHEAAQRLAPALDDQGSELMLRARDGYLGRRHDRWSDEADVLALAHHLAELATRNQ